MKKRAVAGLVAAILAMSSFTLPVYARYDVENSEYVFESTTDLKASIDPGNQKIVLTWPAVDKDGNLIKDNPLKAEGQQQSNGNPTRGWTTPSNGMIIQYTNWMPDGSKKPSNNNKSDNPVIRGIVDTPTEYPIVIKDPKTGEVIKNAYIDTTVVANSMATAYLVEYSLDGINWTEDHTASTFNHGKKLSRMTASDAVLGDVNCDTEVNAADAATTLQYTLNPVAVEISEQGLKNAQVKDGNIDASFAAAIMQKALVSTFEFEKETGDVPGEIKDDNYNTFFLEDQITEQITSSLEPETKYYIRVSAYDQSNKATLAAPFRVFETEITTPADSVLTPAFPTIEGGGMYAQGGRSTEEQQGDVYVVTNLTDSVSDPQPGSLRYGLERMDRADKDKDYPRTIVFAVGGTINVDPTVAKGSRRFNVGSNTTIAGQTAPGEGITIAGASMKFSGSNIIVRYTHFRLGSGYNLDGASASGENIAIDHCTFSYGVDETFSAKELINSSIQYNIIDSGLSIVDKDGVNNPDAELGADSAKHGMGSIINGYNSSFTHNLWSNNGTRNPRFEGGFTYNNVRYENKLDFSNNVIYNWGHGSGYGGDRGTAEVNFESNFFKPGPNTMEKVKAEFFSCDVDGSYGGVRSSYYINGNVMDGNAELTADNTLGFDGLGSTGYQLNEKVKLKNAYTPESAEAAYQNVLDTVGASLKRDAYDNRLIEQVKNNTGYYINDQYEAGGFDKETYTSTLTDTDMDGMPDSWEDSKGLDKNNKNDATVLIKDETSPYNGYTNLEVYINDLVGDWDKTNKSVIAQKAVNITSLKDSTGKELDISVNADLLMGETYTVTCDSTDEVEVYLNDRVLGKGTGSVSFTPDKTGNANLMVKTLGDIRVFSDRIRTTTVDATGNLEGFTSADIGVTRAAGADYYNAATNSLVTQGNGFLGRTGSTSQALDEGFHYNYKQMSGDVTMVAKIYNWAKIDYYQFSGLMIRGDLTGTGEYYASGMTYYKNEDFEGTSSVTGSTRFEGRNITMALRTTAGLKPSAFMPKYLGVPQARAGEEQIGGWAKLVKKGQQVTGYASLDGETWYEIYSYTSNLPENFYVGFATSSAQDTIELVTYNKALFTDISITPTAE